MSNETTRQLGRLLCDTACSLFLLLLGLLAGGRLAGCLRELLYKLPPCLVEEEMPLVKSLLPFRRLRLPCEKKV